MVYFAVNNHMYLILEEAVRKSLIERTKVKENFNTSLLEHEEAKEENNIYNKYKIVVNPTLDMLFQQSENTIYMYSRPGKTNINDIFTSNLGFSVCRKKYQDSMRTFNNSYRTFINKDKLQKNKIGCRIGDHWSSPMDPCRVHHSRAAK